MLPARLLLPGCLRFPRPPSLFPHSPTSLTFRNEVKLNFHCQNLAPRRQASTKLFPSAVVSGTSLCVCRTAFHGVNVNYNRGSASHRGPTGGGQRHWRLKKKRQRRKHTHHWQQFTRAQLPGSRFPAKFGYQPIKLERDPLTHTYPANYVRVHFRPLRVYKESRVAH